MKWTIESVENVLSELVPCEDQSRVHISESCVCARFAFRGVPAGCVDVLIDERIIDHSADDLPIVLERSRKAGKYDGRERDRWLVRRMLQASVKGMGLPAAELMLSLTPRRVSVRVLSGGVVASSADYDRLPLIDGSYDQTACIKRNWTRYFRHLRWEDDVEPRLHEYRPLDCGNGRTTLNELNMHASRWLSDLSYSLGWNRVIRDAAQRNGMPLWVREDHAEHERVKSELYDLQDQLA